MEQTALNCRIPYSDGSIINNIHIEVDIDAAAAATAKATLYAQVSLPKAWSPELPQLINRVLPHVRSFETETEIADIAPFDGRSVEGMYMQAVHIPSASVTEVTLERDDGNVLFERTLARNNRLLSAGERNPQTNWFHIDPTEKGYGGNFIKVAGSSDFRFKVKSSATHTTPVIAEQLGLLGSR